MTTIRLENFRGLAIKGGGVAGVSYLGCLRKWIDVGLKLEQFSVFAGSSVGSVVASFLALRASLQFMEEKLRSTDFSKFLDRSILSKVKDVANMWTKYGWHSGDGLEMWVASVVGELTGNKELTLREAHQRYGTHLVITKTDVLYPECKLVTMDWTSHPEMTIHAAVRASSSIPFFFQAVDGRGQEEEHIFIDGGVMDNYPIECLYSLLPKEQCMGLYVTTPKRNKTSVKGRPVRSHSEFITSILGTWTDAMMGQHISSDEWIRTCSVPTDISAIDFSASKEKQEAAIGEGWKAMDKFISTIRSAKI